MPIAAESPKLDIITLENEIALRRIRRLVDFMRAVCEREVYILDRLARETENISSKKQEAQGL